MKSKYRLFLLMVVVGIFCCGCASETADESPVSEVNEESYDEYSGSWTTGGVSYNGVLFDGGMIWYTPQYEPAEFDVSVFNEIEVHNLDILARLDTY